MTPIRDTDDLIFLVDARLRREALEEAIRALPEIERRVVRLRFGLEDGVPRTLARIAEELELGTPQRVRSIEAAALRRLSEAR